MTSIDVRITSLLEVWLELEEHKKLAILAIASVSQGSSRLTWTLMANRMEMEMVLKERPDLDQLSPI